MGTLRRTRIVVVENSMTTAEVGVYIENSTNETEIFAEVDFLTGSRALSYGIKDNTRAIKAKFLVNDFPTLSKNCLFYYEIPNVYILHSHRKTGTNPDYWEVTAVKK